jgi:hypothetical protein
VTPGKLDPAVAKLVEADIRQLESCYAMALAKQPSLAGAVVLKLRVDAGGSVAGVTVDNGDALGSSLSSCLVSVAERWTLADAAGSTVSVPLTLSSG